MIADPEAEAAEWDLSGLVDGRGDAGAVLALEQAAELAAVFAQRYEGRVATFDAAALIGAMRELGTIRELIQRASVYAQLRLATDTGDIERGQLAQRVRERTTELETQLVFFELEWAALEERQAAGLLEAAGAELDFASQYLRVERRRARHMLGSAEERLMAERRITGEQAWGRLFEELVGGLRVRLDGEEVPYAVAQTQLSDANAGKRAAALEAMATGMETDLKTRTYVFNTLLHDKAVEDRLRAYPTWLSSRNIDNQLDDGSVQVLIDAVMARYDLARRWSRVKARLLGTERLAESDLGAPVLADEAAIPYVQARDLVVAAYADFSDETGILARRFFDESWIDAPIRPHKMAGAFCETGGPAGHPYVLVNYSGRRYDVFALAHELGHGIHDVLAAEAGFFHQAQPMPIAETASTFGELLLLQRMLARAVSDRERLSLLAEAVDHSMMTIFRQVAYNRFEERVHSARRTDGELATERINELYRGALAELYGDTVVPHPGSERGWSVIPHFFLWPGYVYAYAYGDLLSTSLVARYRSLGAGFVKPFEEFLAAGGSRAPEQLGRIVGVDLNDPGFWAAGLDLVEAQISAVEELAASVPHSPS